MLHTCASWGAFTTLEKPEEWIKLGFDEAFKPHAEEIAMKILDKEGILAKDVKAIYSELEPCMLSKHNCKKQIIEKFPHAKVSYSYAFTNNPNVMKKAIFDRGIDLLDFIK